MAGRSFTSIVKIQQAMEKGCRVAIQNTCTILLAELQRLIITEFYMQYSPTTYERTHQFYESATTEMLTDMCGRIFMDEGKMNYISPDWTGATQLEAANNFSHGGVFVGEGRYWDSFIEYCNKNALTILKQELRKQGLSVK